jgi:hypothetical protein
MTEPIKKDKIKHVIKITVFKDGYKSKCGLSKPKLKS